MTQAITENPGAAPPPSGPQHKGHHPWWIYFTFCTDHKVIGIQYLVTTFIFYLIGGALATAVRAELATPASDLVSRELYNQLFTVHATVMIFLWIVPAGTGAGPRTVRRRRTGRSQGARSRCRPREP